MSILTAAQIARVNEYQRHASENHQQETTLSLAMRIAAYCPTGVLFFLGIADGISMGSSPNIEAIIGLLTSLSVVNGALHGATGDDLSSRVCLGMLGRLGVQTTEAATTAECVNLCASIGATHGRGNTLVSRMHYLLKRRSASLDGCIAVLEERGFRVRCNSQLSELLQHDLASMQRETPNRKWTSSVHDEFVIAA